MQRRVPGLLRLRAVPLLAKEMQAVCAAWVSPMLYTMTFILPEQQAVWFRTDLLKR